MISGGGRRKRVPRSAAPEYVRDAMDCLTGARRLHAEGNRRAAAVLSVNAAIRAADAICVARLGEHAEGADHALAVTVLVEAAHRPRARDLSRVLMRKHALEYGVGPVRDADLAAVLRAAERLVDAARAVVR